MRTFLQDTATSDWEDDPEDWQQDAINTTPDPEVQYVFTIGIDRLYDEHGFLKKCLQEIFGLTPDDAELFISEGWHFGSENFKPITRDEIKGTRSISISQNAYRKVVGEISKSGSTGKMGQDVAELTAELERVKNRYDEAYMKYGNLSYDLLKAKGGGRDTPYPVMYADNTRVVLSTPVGSVVTDSPQEPADQKMIREELEKEGGKFTALKNEYPDIVWTYHSGYKNLDEIASAVVNKYRKTHEVTDYMADAYEYTIVARYRSSKQKALQELNSKQLSDTSASPTDELIYYETLRNDTRQVAVDKGLISAELMKAWAGAQIEILQVQTTYRTSKGTISANMAAIQSFYNLLIPYINQKTTSTTINERGFEYELESNPLIEPYKLRSFAMRAKQLPDRSGWPTLFEDFREASGVMDKLITEKLRSKGMSEKADILAYTSEASIELDRLSATHGKVHKVNAFFYTEGITDYMNLYTKEQITNMGMPLQLYLWKEGDEWGLTDLTRAGSGSIPENRNKDLKALFGELDSNLRFPEGEGILFWNVPELDQNGTTVITGDMSLSEWFTYIGLAISAVLLAAATFGASIPATALIIASAVMVTGSVLSMVEKSEQGMLTSKDVVLGLASIVSAASIGIAAGLGKIVAGGLGTTGMAARIAVLADRLYFPVFVAGLGADVVSIATITAEAVAQYQELDKLPDGPAKEDAKKRLLATLILQGTLTIISMKGSLPALKTGKNLRLATNLEGKAVARQDFTEQIAAAKGSKNPDLVLEGRIAEVVEKDLVHFQKKIPPETGSTTEIDIELEDIIIEVGVGKGKKLQQITQRTKNLDNVNPENKTVILYAPNYGYQAAKDIQKAGAIVVRTEQELLDAIKQIRLNR